MKIGIYSPYLDSAGGGERYMLTIAEILSKENNVDVFLDKHLLEIGKENIVKKNTDLLGLDFSKVNFIKAPLGKDSGAFERLTFLKNYDVVFYLTDGSIFFSSARKNILHIQSPIKVNNTSLWKKIKKSSWNLIIYNSEFTKNYCEKFWGIKGEVVYPPVDIGAFRSGNKKKQILTVGRFRPVKKQKEMIKAFKKIADTKEGREWEFILAGGAMESDSKYIEELKDVAKGYEINFFPDIKYEELRELYSQSSIYWHANGLNEEDPAKMEHFGITTVEAMASGCVPIVINSGGQREIVENNENGFLWNDLDELKSKTEKLIADPELLEKFKMKAKQSVLKYSKEEFSRKINKLIKS